MAKTYEINEELPKASPPIEYISFDDLIKKIIEYKREIDDQVARFETEEDLDYSSVQESIDVIWESFINPKKLKDTEKPALPYEHAEYVLVYCRYYSFVEQAKKLDAMLQSALDSSDPDVVSKCFRTIKNLGLISMVAERNYDDPVFTLARETGNIDIIDVYIDYRYELMKKHALYMRETLEFRGLTTKIEIYAAQKEFLKMIELLGTCIPYDRGLLARMNTVISKILYFIYVTDDAVLFRKIDRTHHSPEIIFLEVMTALKDHENVVPEVETDAIVGESN